MNQKHIFCQKKLGCEVNAKSTQSLFFIREYDFKIGFTRCDPPRGEAGFVKNKKAHTLEQLFRLIRTGTLISCAVGIFEIVRNP